MQEIKTSQEFRGHCTQCMCGFVLPSGPKVECDRGQQLAKTFPDIYPEFYSRRQPRRPNVTTVFVKVRNMPVPTASPSPVQSKANDDH